MRGVNVATEEFVVDGDNILTRIFGWKIRIKDVSAEYFSIMAQCPIIPFTTKGDSDIKFRANLLSTILRKDIKLVFGNPVHPNDMASVKSSRKDLFLKVADEINRIRFSG